MAVPLGEGGGSDEYAVAAPQDLAGRITASCNASGPAQRRWRDSGLI